MPSKSRCTNWLACLLFVLGGFVTLPAWADSSGDGYTCTTQSDGTISCTGTKGPSGDPASSSSTGGSSSSGSGTGVVSGLTGWFSTTLPNFFRSLVKLIKDIPISILGAVLSLVSTIVDAIPVPDFMKDFSLGQLLGSAGSDVGFFMSALRISDGFVVVGAAYAFRLLRKLLTLFQW